MTDCLYLCLCLSQTRLWGGGEDGKEASRWSPDLGRGCGISCSRPRGGCPWHGADRYLAARQTPCRCGPAGWGREGTASTSHVRSAPGPVGATTTHCTHALAPAPAPTPALSRGAKQSTARLVSSRLHTAHTSIWLRSSSLSFPCKAGATDWSLSWRRDAVLSANTVCTVPYSGPARPARASLPSLPHPTSAAAPAPAPAPSAPTIRPTMPRRSRSSRSGRRSSRPSSLSSSWCFSSSVLAACREGATLPAAVAAGMCQSERGCPSAAKQRGHTGSGSARASLASVPGLSAWHHGIAVEKAPSPLPSHVHSHSRSQHQHQHQAQPADALLPHTQTHP